MDNPMQSRFDQSDSTNGPNYTSGLPSPDIRLFKVRWRYLALIMLNSLVSLLLLINIFLTKPPSPVVALEKNAGRVPTLASEEEILTGVYEQVGSAVVKIVVAQGGQVDLSRAEPQGDGTGSGLILDHDGHVVTNHHVVDKATDVVVQLAGGRVAKATVVSQDAGTDLAILRIAVSETELTVARFADSDILQVGQIAVAIGYPFGLDQSLTVGHISGLGRAVPTSDKFIPVIEGMIQTDAAINPGNSGGPLLNLQGEVVGINSAIFSTSQGSQGVGFALPSNAVQRVIAELLDKGYVSRAFLGVVGLPLDPERAESLGLEIDQGLLIQEIYPGSPAWQAGLRPGNQRARLGRWTVLVGGDVLLAIEGQPVDSMETLSKLVQAQAIGDTITLKVYRVGQAAEIVTTLLERPASVR
jgi:S1-C subfamily serine protease